MTSQEASQSSKELKTRGAAGERAAVAGRRICVVTRREFITEAVGRIVRVQSVRLFDEQILMLAM